MARLQKYYYIASMARLQKYLDIYTRYAFVSCEPHRVAYQVNEF